MAYHWLTSEDEAMWADVKVVDAAEKLRIIKSEEKNIDSKSYKHLSVKYVSYIMEKQLALMD